MDAATVYLTPSRWQKWIFIIFGCFNLASSGWHFFIGSSPEQYLLQLCTGIIFWTISFSHGGYASSDYYIRADESGVRIKRQYRRLLSLPWQAIGKVSVVDSEFFVEEPSGRRHKVQIRPVFKGHSLDLRAEFRDIVSKYAQSTGIEFIYDVNR